MNYLAITGRQIELSIAELESVLGPGAVLANLGYGCLINNLPGIDRLGGTQKIFELSKVDKLDKAEVENYITNYVESSKTKSRLNIALNDPRQILPSNTLFDLKSKLLGQGLKVRIVKSKAKLLSSAESIHNDMQKNKGLELFIFDHNGENYIGQLISVQNLKSYSTRDRFRPKRDSKVGMLPPKLAQIITNLTQAEAGSTILDPFCGTGVLLQEAMLIGYDVYGTDISKKMIEYSQDNLNWLADRFKVDTKFKLETGSATNTDWGEFDSVACETFLGEAFSGTPSESAILNEVQEVDKLIYEFLKNLHTQLMPGARICIAVPNWQLGKTNYPLTVVDKLDQLGYTWSEFSQVDTKNLIYRRPGQTVGRQLLTLIKN